ncbi:MAG: 1-(5-phosphoribosyl)-5-[(5-phosphoribosylamino)methylideneamino] imidazole-4-carboxamide isomerase [Nanoarchaeota archaeon]|nr:1-(5-phosphoribosyl)-5-[(5-phosphoribosylamino)methylideneamino] imidazole-4-carboxamide isomerase [Nanoarchaeota archaeon]MBU1005475.1 1-(5-phosphoribosyl)-5-[(5-phosphoribosylamino)methylideneamino] imidazole-4-carboxamide isomerase [Nanoarchaeota archaeon]MBU1947045.1 1-(5-phosphoribosyl)-5-[(5-phosphoribosylamino)methylideneamino] imidazole-4-carboxamide isomerase [Nanoarchaeota archaeon]
MIFPSIDLMNGKVVQLVQGKKENKKLEIDDVLGVARKFSKYQIQVIDLDAAMGSGSNLSTVKVLCSKFPCRVGGGIRTVERAKELIKAGAKKIIIGSAAFKSDGTIDVLFLKQLNKVMGKEKIIIAIDSKDGKVVVKGWKESTGADPVKVVKELEKYCSEFLYTYVDKEGMMQGTDFSTLRKLKYATSNEITAAGGISSMDEINRLERLGVNSVLGMALYTGKINLP